MPSRKNKIMISNFFRDKFHADIVGSIPVDSFVFVNNIVEGAFFLILNTYFSQWILNFFGISENHENDLFGLSMNWFISSYKMLSWRFVTSYQPLVYLSNRGLFSRMELS